MTLLERYNRATAELEPPFAVVDLEAFRANAIDLVRRGTGKSIRVASKSVRCHALLESVLATEGFEGVMAFTLPEALWLAGRGLSDDILVAYPTVDRAALADLARDEHAAATITVMVDCAEHLDLIESARESSGGLPIRVCVDIDAAWRTAGGRVRIGVLRSPVRTADEATALAREIARAPGLRLVGLMAYESQISGVGDNTPGRTLFSRAVRFVQAQSRVELARRRAAIVKAVRELTDLEFVNGGGTGSVEKTAAEVAVTEVAAGAGEVQTPLIGAVADQLQLGDRVYFRHAKAGELCERFAGLHLIEGDRVTGTVPTYRGEGRTFL